MSNLDPKNRMSPEALSIAIRNAQDKKINESREFFEQLVSEYPTCGRVWKIYIEQELRARNYERVEKCFQRCLIKVLNIDLWKCYLNYLRDTKGKLATFREKMAQAYDFALEKIGVDVNSYNVWVEYVNFLKSVEALGAFAENQKIAAIRKVFQKGIMNPMINVEQFWKDYCAFENTINPMVAKRLIEERSREFLAVRKVAKDYENMTRGLERNQPAVPPQGTQEEQKQVAQWKKYIEWEKSNPLRSEDASFITKRVMFAFEQCLLVLSYHPDIWFDAATYLQETSALLAEKSIIALSKQFADEAAGLYERAINSFMKNNLLIYFAYADFEESRLNYDKVKKIYDKCLDNHHESLNPSLAYIQYMRFLRRAEGIRSARIVFKKARDDQRCTYHVYVGAALMEYYCTKDKQIALKILQLGLKKYGNIPEYITQFIEYSSHMNDDKVTRELFDDILSTDELARDKKLEVWSELIKFENEIGTIEDLKKAEERRAQLVGDSSQEVNDGRLLIEKFKFLDLLPCNPNDLRLFNGIKQSLTSTPSINNLSNMFSSLNPNKIGKKSTIKKNFPEIRTDLMSPFKPVKPNQMAAVAVQPIPGGVFQYPTLLVELIKRLPPPFSFDGPFVKVDEFMQMFRELNLPIEFQPEPAAPLPPHEMITTNHQEVKIKSEPNEHNGFHSAKRSNEDDKTLDPFKTRHQAKMVKQS